MSAHRTPQVLPALLQVLLLPLCAAVALSACAASTPPAATPPAGEAVGTAPAPAVDGQGDVQTAQAEPTRRLSSNELTGTGGWALRSASGADGARVAALFPEGHEAVLQFEGQRVSARAGCNRMSGDYRTTRDSLTLNLSIMTKMGCPDPLNRVDAVLSERLTGRFRAELLEGMPVRLRLTAEDGSVYVFDALPLQLSQLELERTRTLRGRDNPKGTNDVRANVFLKGGF